ncbi:peptidoglycan binding domain-containing protein [Streptomyces sp. NPDC001922]|uniref:peptidoglycan binding domain-containing protein n=1 Tax=Streptomyces sp. NPDC001922 TaxID=3364624 RepID=UPI00367B64DF
MSRESDSSSSGSTGRGGAAYPSGTPPYGARTYPSLHPTQDDGAHDGSETAESTPLPKSEEQPRTETTLTTRIKINIPGSRPIPPVVMRKPVEEGDTGAGAAAGSAEAPAEPVTKPAAAAPAPKDEPSASAAESTEETRTSDWFAPRKPQPAPPSAPATPPSGSDAPSGPGKGGQQRSDLPYFSEGGAGGNRSTPAAGSPFGSGPGAGPAAQGPGSGPGSTPPLGTPRPGSGPAGPTASGDGDMTVPPAGPRSGAPARGDVPPQRNQQPPGPGGDRRPPAPGIGAVGAGAPAPSGPTAPGRSGPPVPGHSGAGDLGIPVDSGPRAPGGPDGPGAPQGPDHVSGDTLVSGFPAVPPAEGSPFPGSPFPGSAFPGTPFPGSPDADDDAGSAPAPAAAPARPAKKGRSKLVLAGAGVVGLVCVAYGAGLLLDHADVPNGTSVLGVDIGGMSKEAAVQKLDGELSGRTKAPLVVTVDGKERPLKPATAGLTLDTETTVGNAAGRDYNPVSVIGSLFGGAREAEPKIVVDEEKLTAALRQVSGETAGLQDGGIKFSGGKAVAVPGRTHRALDVDKSVRAVEDAFRQRAATGRSGAVELPVGMQKPSIDRAEIARAKKDFADPAMSGLVTVQTDAAHKIAFSPENSLPKFVEMQPINGRLVDTYDLKALQKLYGGTFDGVLVQRGNGQKTPVTPQDVIGALRQALRETSPAKRVAVIETNAR